MRFFIWFYLAVTLAAPTGPVLAGINTFILSNGVGDPSLDAKSPRKLPGCLALISISVVKLLMISLYLLPSLKYGLAGSVSTIPASPDGPAL